MLGKFITHCEDSLTASVFTHLLHLPIELFWQILRTACYDSARLPEYPGEPLGVDYWPKWNPTGTVSNNTYVEPDVLIRFRKFDLIIEAKRWDEGMQDANQWKRELIAYTNVHGEENLPVIMIALGGIHGETTAEVSHEWQALETVNEIRVPHRFVCPVLMCRWRGLLDQCQRMRRELKRLEYADSRAFSTARILDDVVGLFECHGFSTGQWFADFDFSRYSLSTDTMPHHHLLRSRMRELNRK